jgi:hypothetical protein
MTDASVHGDDACAELAARLGLDVDSSGVCLACLGFVAMPLTDGDEATARREARRLVVDLWCVGLDRPLVEALAGARDDGVPGAGAALHDVEVRGPRASIVRAVVLRLAHELAERTRAELRLVADARARGPRGVPELN